jgi:hypothetical protein
MRLTWKDGVSTVLAVATIGVALAVVQERGWPLLGSYRSGAVVLLVMGLGMCALGGSTVDKSKTHGPYFATMSVLGFFALGFAIWAMIADAEGPFLGLAITSVLMWLISTMHHAVGVRPAVRGAR